MPRNPRTQETQAMGSETTDGSEKRNKPRLQLNLPVDTELNGSGLQSIEMVDISSTGMQIKSNDVDIFKGKGFARDRQDRMKLSVVVRLAWAEPDPEGGLLTGWEFVQEDGDQTPQ